MPTHVESLGNTSLEVIYTINVSLSKKSTKISMFQKSVTSHDIYFVSFGTQFKYVWWLTFY